MTRVLVTGAGGFVGRVLCPELSAAGFEVIAAARRRSAIPARVAFRPIPDLGPATDWGPALAGIEAVVHLAALVHQAERGAGRFRPGGKRASEQLAAYRRVNTEGTRRLAAAAARAGVRRFVYLSTAKVNGERTTDHPFRETDGPAPQGPYATSKWEAEEALRDVAAGSGLEPVVLRPPLVYGPGVKGNFRALVRAVARGWPLPVGAIANRRSFLYVGTLADAICRALGHEAAAGNTYLVSDGEDISTPELVRRVAAALGKPARVLAVPVPLLRLAGGLAGKGAAVGRLVDSLVVDSARIRRELDWRPPFTMAEGLAMTGYWYRAQGPATG